MCQNMSGRAFEARFNLAVLHIKLNLACLTLIFLTHMVRLSTPNLYTSDSSCEPAVDANLIDFYIPASFLPH